MGWEKHGEKTYFYRSFRCEGKVRKIYYGAGDTGKLASAVDARNRAQREKEQKTKRTRTEQLVAAQILAQKLDRMANLLASAALLAASFHRPKRHTWRTWRNGRRSIRECC